jgi:hypothetical protein
VPGLQWHLQGERRTVHVTWMLLQDSTHRWNRRINYERGARCVQRLVLKHVCSRRRQCEVVFAVGAFLSLSPARPAAAFAQFAPACKQRAYYSTPRTRCCRECAFFAWSAHPDKCCAYIHHDARSEAVLPTPPPLPAHPRLLRFVRPSAFVRRVLTEQSEREHHGAIQVHGVPGRGCYSVLQLQPRRQGPDARTGGGSIDRRCRDKEHREWGEVRNTGSGAR